MSETTPLLQGFAGVQKENGSSKFSSIKGQILIAVASIVFALNVVLTKYLYYHHIPPTQANFFISGLQGVTMALALRVQNLPFKPQSHLSETLKVGAFQGMINVLWLFSVFFADAGNCASFLGLLPLIIACLSYILNLETIPIILFSFISTASIIAVIMIIQPPILFTASPTTSQEPFGYLLMMGAILSIAMMAVFQRKQRSSPVNSTRATSFGGIFACITYCLASFWDSQWVSASLMTYLIILFISSIKAFAYYAMTKGCSLCEPTISGLLFLLEIPSTYLLEMILLGTVLNWLTYGGVLLLLISVGFYLVYTSKASTDDHHEETPL